MVEDAVTGIYTGETADHPVLQLLARAIEAGDLPLHAFRNMIERENSISMTIRCRR